MKICNTCGADIRPGAVKCSCCGNLVMDVAVDSSAAYLNFKPGVQAPESQKYYGTPASPMFQPKTEGYIFLQAPLGRAL